jgi:hypothetical protein
MDGIARWNEFANGLAATLSTGRRMVAEGKAYIYRVGRSIYSTAFARYLTHPEGDEWPALFSEALELFALSAERDDCQPRREYPFNLAGLLLEWYLGQWLLGQESDPSLLDRSINLFADGLWGEKTQPLGAMAALPPGYLLRQDREHLANFWEILARQVDLDRLPDELALWRAWSNAFIAGETTPAVYWSAYESFAKSLKDPTDKSASFYLVAAKIGLDSFGLAEPRQEVLRRLAVRPWREET